MGTLRRASGSSRLFVFALVLWGAPNACGVHSGSRGLTRARLWSTGSFGFEWVYSGAPRGRRVYSGSRRSTKVLLEVVGLIRVHVDSLWRS